MGYKWQSDNGSHFIKTAVFRYTFPLFRSSQNGTFEVTRFPGDSLFRYFKSVDSLDYLTFYNLEFFVVLSNYHFGFVVEFSKFFDSIKKWIIKLWTTETNCFIGENPSLSTIDIIDTILIQFENPDVESEVHELARTYVCSVIGN